MFRYTGFVILSVVALGFGTPAWADVVVVANATEDEVPFTITTSTGDRAEYVVAAGDQVSVAARGRSTIDFAGREPVTQRLDANPAYHFVKPVSGPLELRKIDLGGDESTSKGRDLGTSEPPDRFGVISVKLLVDDTDPENRQGYEARLRERVRAASEVFEAHCRMRFDVVAFETWTSTPTDDFLAAAREFAGKVDPRPARLAIGFIRQTTLPQGTVHLGVATIPLESHILIREWLPGLTEPERLEVLIHELGHFLGATHSPQRDSVMRPKLGDGRARARSFRIGFDPANTLAMYLIAEEIRLRRITRVSQLSGDTRLRLRQIYETLAKALPDDPASPKYLALVAPGAETPLSAATREVVKAIVSAARDNAELAPAARRTGDALTEVYFRRAASAAAALPDELAVPAFLCALGIAVDDSDILLQTSLTREFCQNVEPLEQRRERLTVLGEPTMRGRRDLAQHFVVSCFLTAAHGSLAAEAAGVAKELLDAKRGSGFSFADLAADKAGVAFAARILAQKTRCRGLADTFSVADYMPSVAQLPEGIGWDEFVAKYGGEFNPRFQQITQEILDRIHALPPYRSERGE